MAQSKSKTIDEKVVDALVDATFDSTVDKGKPATPSNSGNPTLDACLNDPATREQIGKTVAASAVTGGVSGFAVGAAVGAGLMGLMWAIWPKAKK